MSKKFDEAVVKFCLYAHDLLNNGPGQREMAEALVVMQDCISKSKAFVPPTPEEVEKAGKELGFGVNGDEFCDFYGSKNWMVGKTKMKNWKMALSRAIRDGWCVRKKTKEDLFQESLPDADDPILDELFGKVAG